MSGLTMGQMRAELAQRVADAGGVRQWAAANGMCHSSVSLIMRGHRDVPETVGQRLGYTSVTTWIPLERK